MNTFNKIKHWILAVILIASISCTSIAQKHLTVWFVKKHLITRTHFIDTTFNNLDIDKFEISNKIGFDFRHCNFKGYIDFGSLYFTKGKRLSIHDSKVTGEIRLSFTFPLVRMSNDTIDYLFLEIGNLIDWDKSKFQRPTDSVDFVIERSIVHDFEMYSTNVRDFTFREIKGLKTMYLSEVKFIGSITLKDFQLPDSLVIHDVDFTETKGEMNLTNYENKSNKICALMIRNTDCSRINLNYSQFHLCFPDSVNNDERASVYQQLLNNFKIRGKLDSYEKLDKEYQEFNYTKNGSPWGSVENYVDKTWWDYGYNKLLIFRISFILFAAFFFSNLFSYPYLLDFGYTLESFKKVNDEQIGSYWKRLVLRMPFVFLYTCFIFWWWKLDINRMNIRKVGIFIYILFQYLIGFVCLAYIFNFVLSR